jgi:hypothetical protein
MIMSKTTATIPQPAATATKTPAPNGANDVSLASLPTIFHTPPSPLRLAESPLEARLDEFLNGDLAELQSHNPDGSFRMVSAIVEKQVGDVVHLAFGNKARDTAPRSKCRKQKSIQEGASDLFGAYMEVVSPRLDASFWASAYDPLRGAIGLARFAQPAACNMVAMIVAHIGRLNAAARAEAARLAKQEQQQKKE